MHTTLCVSQCYKPRLSHKAVQRNGEQVSALKAEFGRGFADFKSMKDQFDLLKCPFSFDIEEA